MSDLYKSINNKSIVRLIFLRYFLNPDAQFSATVKGSGADPVAATTGTTARNRLRSGVDARKLAPDGSLKSTVDSLCWNTGLALTGIDTTEPSGAT
jgi:hypothetical protein